MRASIIAAALVSLTTTAVAQKVKVMLLGDSITEITCWRTQVWTQLTSAGLASNVDLVGSMSDLDASCTRPSGFDPNHEGHSGYQAYDVARNNIVGWLQNTKPDVIQFMLGTNDVNIGKHSVQDILNSYTMILTAMRNANPNVKVIIDKMIPTSWSDATIESVNTNIPSWASSHTTSQSPITVADCSRANGFTNAMLRNDGVHPNAAGDTFIAEQVGPKLIDAIKAVSGGGGTGTATTTLATSTTTASFTTSSPTSTTNPSCAAMWGQCGGLGFSGPTCCSAGTCKASNQYYSQCT
ncbi:SGNH hydrolase-type esterase domain-containing protein [Xylariaceae sp. FL1651]|nr:SGNH hydrolase-type esterase domain-containing protein [Xylariaceae sp. FL1651]